MARNDDSTFNGQLDLKGVIHVHHLPPGDPIWPYVSSRFETNQPSSGWEDSAIDFLRAEKNATTESIQKKLDEALAAKAHSLDCADGTGDHRWEIGCFFGI